MIYTGSADEVSAWWAALGRSELLWLGAFRHDDPAMHLGVFLGMLAGSPNIACSTPAPGRGNISEGGSRGRRRHQASCGERVDLVERHAPNGGSEVSQAKGVAQPPESGKGTSFLRLLRMREADGDFGQPRPSAVAA